MKLSNFLESALT
ncbi:unnamed protein product, partial [Allacma fusca]